MKIETTPRDDHQVQITVEIEPQKFESARHRAAHKVSEKIKIPGFRPGKAPFDVVVRQVGEESIKEEATELLVDEIYPDIIKEAGITPAAPGSLTDISVDHEPYQFTFVVPLEPTVDLGDYKAIHQEYQPPVVTDEEVAEFLKQIQNANSVVEPAGRPAQEGDLLYLTLSWTIDGIEIDKPQNAPYQVIIPTEEKLSEMEWPFQGFSRGLIGKSEGDIVEVEHSYPEDFQDPAMKGKTVHYSVIVNSVKTFNLPEINDEFAQSLGDLQNLDELKARVREQLEANHQAEYDDQYFTEIIDQIVSQSTIKYPPQVLDEQKEDVLHNLEHDLSHQNMDLETYLKTRNMEKEEFIEKEVTPAAIKRLERSLILNEVSKLEKLEINQDELQNSFQETLDDLSQTEEFQELSKKMPKKQLANAVATEAANRLMNRKIFETLKTIASGRVSESAPVDTATNDSSTDVLAKDESTLQPEGDHHSEEPEIEA